MSAALQSSPKKRTRVLFLAWGFSIHAKRRIQIFADDPTFEVAVVSNYDYGFEQAANFLLKGMGKREGFCNRSLEAVAALRFLLASLIIMRRELARCPGVERKLINQLRDFASCRSVMGSLIMAAKDAKTVKDAVLHFKPNVIFLQTLLYPCYLAFYLPPSIPVVVTFWNGDLTWQAQWNSIEKVFKEAFIRHGIRRASAITVNSTTAYESAIHQGAAKEKTFLIRYPGVDLEQFRPLDKNEAKREIGIVHDRVILCPRGLGGYLNSDVIIEAVQKVIQRFPGALFLFLSRKGDEQEWKRHLQRAQSLGVGGNVRCDNQVPWEAMPTYYNASDVMISISSYDSLPNCLLEAMACQVAVITSDLRQLREWIKDGINGFAVPPRNSQMLADRILNALEDRGGQTRVFGRRNRELVSELANSRTNADIIKNLVRKVSKHCPIDSPDSWF